jgi:hypothetical protein
MDGNCIQAHIPDKPANIDLKQLHSAARVNGSCKRLQQHTHKIWRRGLSFFAIVCKYPRASVSQICQFIIEMVFPGLLTDSYYNNSSLYYMLGVVILMINGNWRNYHLQGIYK